MLGLLRKKNHCSKCKSTKHLHVNSTRVNKAGKLIKYYYCRACTSARLNKYYHNGNQKKFAEANKRYAEKKNKK